MNRRSFLKSLLVIPFLKMPSTEEVDMPAEIARSRDDPWYFMGNYVREDLVQVVWADKILRSTYQPGQSPLLVTRGADGFYRSLAAGTPAQEPIVGWIETEDDTCAPDQDMA